MFVLEIRKNDVRHAVECLIVAIIRNNLFSVRISPRERDTSSNRRRGSRRGKKEFVCGGKKANEKAPGKAPRLPGASWTMRRGYYGARAFLRGGPIGRPLSRDDCNTFGAAYNIGTRGASIFVSFPARPSLRLVLRVPGPTLEAVRCRSGPDRSTETHTKGRAPDCFPLSPFFVPP